jgi:hypothetical protein
MTIEAKIICDSISPQGIRLVTMQLRYPRFIHAEELTHRIISTEPEGIFYEAIPDGFMYDKDLSRNASSSRAIPVDRMIEDLRRDPAQPVYWGSNKPGMQAGAELEGPELEAVKNLWNISMENSILFAQDMVRLGLHKQIANRILEPWAHINVVVTATEWDNFFALRAHKDAQPEMQALAISMMMAKHDSNPAELQPGEWHLPYVTKEDFSAARFLLKKGRVTRDEPMYDELVEKVLIGVSVARCARVSYLTHDGRQTTVEEDHALYERLVGGKPIHASPAEHQATPDEYLNAGYLNSDQHGNFQGWRQYRKMIEDKFQ